MFEFQKTKVYQEAIKLIADLTDNLDREHNPILCKKIEEESFSITSNLAKGLLNINSGNENSYMNKCTESMMGLSALIDVAKEYKELNPKQITKLSKALASLKDHLSNFKKRQKRILILSGTVGQGHMSAANAIKDAIHHCYGYDYTVEIVDIMELISSTMNSITKTYYDSTTKYAPSLYKLWHENAGKNNQVMKLLNQVTYPFALTKIKKLLEDKKPDIIVSTFPIWDYIVADIWKKSRKDAKLISVITDSIKIHNVYTLGEIDFHIVANKESKQTLLNMDVNENKIKVLGFPVKLAFQKTINREDVLTSLGLNPKKLTVLFLPTAQSYRKNQQIVQTIIKDKRNPNIIIITGRDSKNKPRLEKLTENTNAKVIGWTEKMAEFIKASDLIVTKAGGATTMECIAAQKPMVITSIIPGPEEGNVEFIKTYNLGRVSESMESFAEDFNYVASNLKMFAKNLKEASNPDASIKIAEFINDLLEAESYEAPIYRREIEIKTLS
ncbi:hypothetical protein GF340_02270 [Candidatus Peregrinibacteria bacterium]|nr:hypothetical protein [Candidatus Peregrinibacteria bacterium]